MRIISGEPLAAFRLTIYLCRLFACYNDGIINLLEKYFEMQKKTARDALDVYKKFLIRMDRVAEFLKVAEVGNISLYTPVHILVYPSTCLAIYLSSYLLV